MWREARKTCPIFVRWARIRKEVLDCFRAAEVSDLQDVGFEWRGADVEGMYPNSNDRKCQRVHRYIGGSAASKDCRSDRETAHSQVLNSEPFTVVSS